MKLTNLVLVLIWVKDILGSLPFDMANVEDANAFLVQPEDRKKVEKNYQVLIAIKMFQESLVVFLFPLLQVQLDYSFPLL